MARWFVITLVGWVIVVVLASMGVREVPLSGVSSPTVSTPAVVYLPYVPHQPYWQPAGLAGHTVRALLGSGSTTFAGVEPGGVYRAADCALAWQPRGLADQSVFALVQAVDGRLYAGTFGGGVYRSTDSGQAWQTVNRGLSDPRIYGLAAHPSLPTLLAAGYDRGMYRTTNGGDLWQRSAPNDMNELNAALFDPGLPAIAYAGTYQRGLYKSNDTGATFMPSSTGLPAQVSVWVIAAVQASGVTTVTLGTSDGVYVSTDNGSRWQSIGLRGEEVRALAPDPGDAAHWFAGTRAAGVWETTDAGATWRNINQGLPPQRAVYALRLLPGPCSQLAVGTNDGVYRRPVWMHTNSEMTR